MKHPVILVMTMLAAGFVACSDDSGDDGPGQSGAGGMGGTAGAGGSSGSSGAGAGGASGMGGGAGSNNAGAGGSPVPPTPALPDNAPTVTCPTVINGSLEASDATQTGRHSRIAPVSACGATKAYPGNAADPTNPHLFDVYRFSNPSASPVCFNFTLTYGGNGAGPGDAGVADAGGDAGVLIVDAGTDAGNDGVGIPGPAPIKYLTAHSTFYPTDLGRAHLGDVGDTLQSPQSMGITVPAGGTIDVVVYAVDIAPAGVGPYTLSCSTQ